MELAVLTHKRKGTDGRRSLSDAVFGVEANDNHAIYLDVAVIMTSTSGRTLQVRAGNTGCQFIFLAQAPRN